MKKSLQVLFFVAIVVGLVSLTGCMHGETFAEFQTQLFCNDPMVCQVVPPNDTMVDENGLAFAREVQENIEQRKNFSCDVKLIPSVRLAGFIRNNGIHQDFAKTTATRIFAGFNALSDFNFVGNEIESMETIPGVTTNSGEYYSLIFDIISLNLSEERPSDLNLVGHYVPALNGTLNGAIRYGGTSEVALTLLAPDGKQKLYLHVKPSVGGCASYNDARDALADAAVQMLLAEYANLLAPPAAVDEVRGNGLFARINVGSAFGMQCGSYVRFVEQVMVKNPITGAEEFRQTQIADGFVKQVGNDYAWVKVNYFHYRRVHIGTLVMRNR